MKKLLLIVFIFWANFGFSQTTQTIYTNVLHGDTLYQVKIINTYSLNSETRYIYSNHSVPDSVLVGDSMTYFVRVVLDTTSYTYPFKTLTGITRDSVQLNKFTTASLPNTAGYVSSSGLKTVNSNSLVGNGDISVAGGAGPTRVFLPNDVINNNAVANTIADVTGLSFPVVANTTYQFKFFIVYNSAATTTGSRWSINGPAATFMNYTSNYTLTATSITNNQGLASYNVPAASNASSLTTNNIAIITGNIRPSANGTVIARFASEVLSSAITAVASGKSYVEYQIIN